MTKNSNENYTTLKAIVEALDTDFSKFQNKKIKACGNRVRNNLLNIKKICDELRKQILDDIKELPTRHRKTTLQIEAIPPMLPLIREKTSSIPN